MRPISVLAAAAMSAGISAFAVPATAQITFAQPIPQAPKPEGATDPVHCEWQWREGAGAGVTLGLWAERCTLGTGLWDLVWREELPGFVQTLDGKDHAVALRLFAKPVEAGVQALLPELRTTGLIPDDKDCVFEPAEIRAVPRTLALFEIRPAGARLAAFEAAPVDQVPEPPCGPYGWAPDGVRYFLTDIRVPQAALFVDTGQDGRLFDEGSIRLRPAP